MALKLFAVLIVLAAVALAPQWFRYRQWRGFDAWLGQLQGSGGLAWLLLAVLLPTLVTALVMAVLRGALFDLLPLAFSVLVLGYCLRELGPDIEAVLKAGDSATRARAAESLYHDQAVPDDVLDAANLVEATVLAALRRRFGVLFWFLLLGPAGAVLYHFGTRAASAAQDHADNDAQRMAARLSEFLDWIPAHLMALAIALASNFDAVAQAWRRWHGQAQRVAWEFGAGFLGAIARAGVQADVDAGDGDAGDGDDTGCCAELADTQRLLSRVLVIWLAAAAVIVLAGWVV